MNAVRIGWVGHGARALALAASLACATVLAVWHLQPELVHALDARIRRAYEEPWLDRWNAALSLQATDPAAALQQLDALARDLGFVRELDRGAVLVRMVSQHALALATQLGRLDSARWHAQRLHAFDDRDLGALVQYCSLLAADATGRTEAIALLRPVVQRFPGHAPTAGLLAALLLAAGDGVGALDVLETAAGDTLPAQWDVRWGTAPEEQCWLLPVACGPGGLVASFTVDHAAPLVQLEFQPPEGRAIGSLGVQVAGAADTLVATAAQPGTPIRVTLPVPQPPGRSAFTLQVQTGHALPSWLRDAVLGEPGRALAAALATDAAARERLARLQERCR